LGKLNTVYAKLPTLTQHLAVSTYGLYWNWLRFGSGYKRFEKEYVEREKWSEQEWKRWQLHRLQTLLPLAANHVPYYRDTWTPEEKRAAQNGQLEALPLLEKTPLRKFPKLFLREDMHPRPCLTFHTSGSTGTPIESIWTVQEVRNSLALREVRSARWAGVSFKMPRATFSGRMVEPEPDSSGPYYRFNLFERQVYFSPFHLRPDTAYFYVEALRRHNIQWMTGYAVSYYLLAKFILEQGLDVPKIKSIITTSEKVTPTMRRVMEKAYGARVFEEYSTVENVVFASECEYGCLHVSPDAGVVEILRPDGIPCDLGEVGEVVATCLMRDYHPLIRFRLGDLAAWDPDPCPCNRAMPVLREVVGRVEDVVIGLDGRQMVRFHGIFVNQPHVIEGQIIQESLNLVRVKVVPTKEFSPHDIQDIIDRMHQRLGSRVEILVETVQHIPRTPAGKFRAVVSMLSPEQINSLNHNP